MKNILLVLFLFAPLTAAADLVTDLTDIYADVGAPPREEEVSKIHGVLGGAMFNTDKIVGEKERKTGVLPLLHFSYADTAYWSIGGGGVWLLKSDDRKARAGLALRVRRGISAEDDAVLAGMSDRDASIEAGINALWRTSSVTIGASYYMDVSGTSEGGSASLRLSWPIKLNSRLQLTPSVAADWSSQKLVDYYYGVRPSETTAFRPAYSGRAAMNVRLAVGASYRLTDRWLLLGGVTYTKLGDGITESPIVNRDDAIAVYVGPVWAF